ncbi:MAG: ribosome silencing factor [Firmicutes bacterium]|nr:ribosome silencing factor [Bacillota bacterium]
MLFQIKWEGTDSLAEQNLSNEQLARIAVAALESKKGSDIVNIDMRGRMAITDYFVIATGHSTTQVKALSTAVEDALEEIGIRPARKEGFSGGRWILLDYGGVVIHIFHQEARDYYDLEHYWQDLPRVNFSS